MSAPLLTDSVVRTAEQAALGAAIKSRRAYEQVSQIITGADFADPRHEVIWDAIGWVNAQGTPEDPTRADEVLVAARLLELDQLERTGGALYLDDLVAAAVVTANAPSYARQVKRSSRARALSILGTQLQEAARGVTSEEELDQIAGAALRVLEGDDLSPAQDVVHIAPFENLDGLDDDDTPVIPTGLRDLDAMLDGGLAAGQLVVVAARPGVGKSVLALQSVLNAARGGHPSVLYSLEMGIRRSLFPRLLANAAGVNLSRFKQRDFTDAEWARIAEALPALEETPLYWSDSTSWTPASLAASIASFTRAHSAVGIVAVDYLQLLTAGVRAHTRQEEVAAMTRELKLVAMRQGVPIMLLAQLNRQGAQRTDKTPQLTDLRESGAIEQDADVVLMLHDPAEGDPDHERAGELEIHVRKNREGQTGVVRVSAQLHHARLLDLAYQHDAASEEGF